MVTVTNIPTTTVQGRTLHNTDDLVRSWSKEEAWANLRSARYTLHGDSLRTVLVVNNDSRWGIKYAYSEGVIDSSEHSRLIAVSDKTGYKSPIIAKSLIKKCLLCMFK